MDQLTKQFFANKFPGYTQPVSLAGQVLATNVPVVELDFNVDFSTLFTIDNCKGLLIPPTERQIHPYEYQPRIKDWTLDVLWSDGSVVPAIKDLYYKKFYDAVPQKDIVPESKNIHTALTNLGFNVELCWVSAFGANGYVRPHRDISTRTFPLSYFWVPINNPIGSQLKIYPYGPVDIKLGKMYLLNQENFIHAVLNDSNEIRYSVLGFFNPNIPSNIAQTIKQAIKAQYQ